MKRILVTGPPGSGKSTLARELRAILGLPVIHLDLLHWNPGWIETPQEEFDARLRAALRNPSWICDGNYGRTMAMRMEHADTIVFLDLPRWLCIRRVIARRGAPRPDLPDGCPERLWSRDFAAFLRWIWDYPTRSRPTVLSLLANARADTTVVHLRSAGQVASFLDGLRRERSVPARASAPGRRRRRRPRTRL